MIRAVIPLNYDFNYKQCKKLYKRNYKILKEDQEFRDTVQNTFFYSFYDDDIWLGFIYFYYKDDKLYVNTVAANRHKHLENLQCMKLALSWFNCDVYAKTDYKNVILCLYRLGFKKVAENLYKYER